jgi:hypothetical protein
LKKFISKRGMIFALSVIFLLCLILLFLKFFVTSQKADSVHDGKIYYVDAANGNDNENDGLSESRPWQSISKVNNANILPGDSVLFKKGSVWKNDATPLLPKSGNDGRYVTYGAYGSGEKPIITMARDRGDLLDWQEIGSNIWITPNSTENEAELLQNPSFESDTSGWSKWFKSPAAGNIIRTTETGKYDSSPGGLQLAVTNNGSVASDIQLTTKNISVKSGYSYELKFKAKASSEFSISAINLLQGVDPFTKYSSNTVAPPTIKTSWQNYSFVFVANATATDAAITFLLGNSIPDNSTFYLDSLSLKSLTNSKSLTSDVGNIIMENNSKFGVKVWSYDQLNVPDNDNDGIDDNQGRYWYNRGNKALYFYSVGNPAVVYHNDIELVSKDIGISMTNRKYVIIDGLHISKAYYGIFGMKVDYIKIRNCDISLIGGSRHSDDPEDSNARAGNGIEFWEDASNTWVENNKVWQVYDAGITTQGLNGIKSNQYFYNNLVWDCEYGFELWHNGTSMTNIQVANNTFENNGNSWGHEQRPDGKTGVAFIAFTNAAETSEVSIRNNIFGASSFYNFYFKNLTRYPWLNNTDVIFDNNLYVVDGNKFAFIINSQNASADPIDESTKLFTLADWQTQYAKDANSLASPGNDSLYIAKNDDNFHLKYGSMAVDHGLNLSSIINKDLDGRGRPQGASFDIGSYER